jgi:hypothetical protein
MHHAKVGVDYVTKGGLGLLCQSYLTSLQHIHCEVSTRDGTAE